MFKPVILFSLLFLLQTIRLFPAKNAQEFKVYSVGPCDDPNPCLNNCTCVKVGNVDYYCNNSISGFLGRNCSKSPPRVFCDDDLITIHVPKWFVSDMTSHYRPNDKVVNDALVYISSFDVTPSSADKCIAEENDLPIGEKIYKLVIKSPFHACGTTSRIYIGDDNIERIAFENSVWWKKSLGSKNFLPFHLYSFECNYEDKDLINSSVNPKCCDAVSIISSIGNVSLDMKFWKSSPQNNMRIRPLAPPFAYLVNQTIHVTVTATEETGKSNFYLNLVDCYISTSFKSETSSNVVHLIKEKCPTKNNSAHVKVIKNGVGIKSVFSYDVIPMKNATHFYLHCRARLCKQNCATKCENATKDMLRNKTVINEINQTSNQFVLQRTLGPVEIHDQQIDLDFVSDQNVTPQPVEDSYSVTWKWAFPIVLVFSNFTCVALLGVLCYTIARSVEAKRRTRFRRLNAESLFISTDFSAIDDSIAICQDENCSFNSKKKLKPKKGDKSKSTSNVASFNSPRFHRFKHPKVSDTSSAEYQDQSV